MKRYSRLMLPLLVYGCSRAAGPPEPVIQPAPGTVVPITPPSTLSNRVWAIIPAAAPHRYSSTAAVSLELASDSGTTRETMSQRARFTLLTGSASGSTSFLGSIEALTTDAPTRIGQPTVQPTFPFTFTGHIQDGTVILDAFNGQSGTATIQCSNPAVSALNIVQRNIIILPAQLRQGMMWKDSTTAAGCSGPIPTTTVSVRNYTVIGETELAGRPAIIIDRIEKTLSTGEGSENQHRVLIRNNGTGTAKIYVDRTSGALLSSESEQHADVIVTAGRARRFKQIVKETTTVEN